jgi:hypothetical protein
VNTNTGGIPATGNIVITQSLIRPIVIPYVGANFRLGHDFLLGSRPAVYFTTAVGFNGYNTTAEYVVGPSFSWRMIMLSPLFHIGHDVHFTQGERSARFGATRWRPLDHRLHVAEHHRHLPRRVFGEGLSRWALAFGFQHPSGLQPDTRNPSENRGFGAE